MALTPGIYEQLINVYITARLHTLDTDTIDIAKDSLDIEDARVILSNYCGKLIYQALHVLKDNHRPLGDQIALCNAVVKYLTEVTADDSFQLCELLPDAEILRSLTPVSGTVPWQKRAPLPRPVTSISQSSLFTGSPYEPSMASELKREMASADRIDMLISFIKWSGIRLLMEELQSFTRRGKLRVIATSYMGATDAKAVEFLASLPNTEVKISYDTERTRLHAKSYYFYRASGFSTAYVGSSNLSNPAITSGLEWNVKVTEQDARDIISKIEATFETYWNDEEFRTFTPGDGAQLNAALLRAQKGRDDSDTPYPFEIVPFYYQKEILERLRAERTIHGHYRNLIVAATGTGKTIISAFDYRDLTSRYSGYPRLLFVAHREEILRQSLAVFRAILKDPNFGDLLVGRHRPSSVDHLFISIQSFNSRDLTTTTPPDFYDMIIVDEFHHAAAPSYQRLLEHYRPNILLGLTATPERADDLDILSYFDGRIAAEIRLPEAIDRKLLAPFHYFGVTDTVDLDEIAWTRGTYDAGQLSRVYTGNTVRAERIKNAVEYYSTDVDEIIGLGFCVSVEHARFMAKMFTVMGIPSEALHAQSPQEERTTIQRRLVNKEINFIFVVDLYNEGIDIPEINTVLFLRPTESLTIFIQQLGRGLRLSEGKECLTVLDFVGRHNSSYRFGEKLSALLYAAPKPLFRQVEEESYYLPKGCHIQLEKVAKEKILENIRAATTQRRRLVDLIRHFEERNGLTLTLRHFLEYYDITPKELYAHGSFRELCERAGLCDPVDEPCRTILKRAANQLIHLNSSGLIEFILSVLENPAAVDPATLSPEQARMLCIFYYSLYDQPLREEGQDVAAIFPELFDHGWLRQEILDILTYNYDHLSFVEHPVHLGFSHALGRHCTYTRDQIFAGLGHYTLTEKSSAGSREGVVFLQDKNLDVFFVNLNKSEKDFSPTTMYDDYAISERLFHWQSQSTTGASSPTGQRYIHHKEQGSRVLFFVRDYKKINNRAQPFICLGTADYVSHEGSRPMNIVWELTEGMPPLVLKNAQRMVLR